MKGTDRYVATDEYIPLVDRQEPPFLYYNGWFFRGEIYNIRWDDRSIIATKYPKKNSYHEYYVIYACDSILVGNGSDILVGPLTKEQKDSIIAARSIDLSKMKEIDFN